MGLKAANKPILDEQGYATAIVTKAEFNIGKQEIRNGKDDIDIREYQRFELSLLVKSTVQDIAMTVFAGTVLNDAIDYKGVKKIPVYNRLTTLALSLDIVKPDELKDITPELVASVENALLNLQGESVKFQLGRVEGRTLTVPVPSTFKRLEGS